MGRKKGLYSSRDMHVVDIVDFCPCKDISLYILLLFNWLRLHFYVIYEPIWSAYNSLKVILNSLDILYS